MKDLLNKARGLITGTHLADSHTLFEMQDAIEGLLQLFELKNKALEFYANYAANHKNGDYHFQQTNGSWVLDEGDTARQALEEGE